MARANCNLPATLSKQFAAKAIEYMKRIAQVRDAIEAQLQEKS